MSVFSKVLAKPLEPHESASLVAAALQKVAEAGDWQQIWLFGSAAQGEMTSASDLDFVVVYPDSMSLKEGRALYYSSSKRVACPLDVLFVTSSDFVAKSEIGGVFFVCRKQGKRVLIRETR